MKLSKKVIIACVVIVVVIIAVILAIVLSKKNGGVFFLKGDNNYKLDFTDKYVTDDYQKVAVTDIAVADNYMFIKYDIDLTDKGKGYYSTENNNLEGFSFDLIRNVIVNGDEIGVDTGEIYQIAKKNNEESITVYDILKMDSIPEKFNIDIEFIKTQEDVVSQEEMELDEAVYKEHLDTTKADSYELEDVNDVDLSNEDLAVEVDENQEPEDLVMDEVDTSLEIELAGLENFKGTKEEATQNVNIKRLDAQVQKDGLTVVANSIVETPFGSFLIVNSTINEVSADADPDLLRIDIQDENRNTIDCPFIQNNDLFGTGNYDENDWEIERGEVTTIFLLNDDVKSKSKIMLQPYYFTMLYDDENAESIINNLEWRSIDLGNQEDTNELGGKVLVKSVESKDEQLYFYVEKTGFVPTMDRLILIRNSSYPNGFCMASESFKTSDGITVYFEKNQIDSVNEKANGGNLQYTIMEPITYRVASDAMEINL